MIKERKTRRPGHVSRVGERGGAYIVVMGSPERTRPFGRPRSRWYDNIKMNLQEDRWAHAHLPHGLI